MDRNDRWRHGAVCPECGCKRGQIDWCESCLQDGVTPGVPGLRICFECCACGCLFEASYHMTDDSFFVTESGKPDEEELEQEKADQHIAIAKERGDYEDPPHSDDYDRTL